MKIERTVTSSAIKMSMEHRDDQWDQKSPIKFEIESTDRRFLLKLINWLEQYPRVDDGSTTVRISGATP